MNIKEMRQLPDEELRAEIDKARDKLFHMRFQGKGKDLENPGLLRTLRKDVARLATVMSERRIRKEARAAVGSSLGENDVAGGVPPGVAVAAERREGGPAREAGTAKGEGEA